MYQNTRAIFDDHLSSIKFDKVLVKEIKQYNQEFINKNDDHIHFFGSNLTGVYPVRFNPSSDKLKWTVDIFNMDEPEIRREIIKLPDIQEHWIRGTDVMNLSCFYITHRFLTSSLTNDDKYTGAFETLLALQFKLIGSLMAWYFKYNVDESTAKAVYAVMSKRYAIKQHGNWLALLQNRCKDILDPKGIHYQTLIKFDDDKAIQNMVTDVQNRLKSLVKNVWAVLEQVREQNNKIVQQAGTVELDGHNAVRDLTRQYPQYLKYLNTIALDKRTLVKADLVSVIGDAMPTMPERLLVQSLNFFSELCAKQDKQALKLIEETLVHAFEYLANDRAAQAKMNDLPALISRLRALYMASKSSDPAVLIMRDISGKLVDKAINSKNQSLIASVRTGLLLYLVLRTFAMKYYS